MADFNKISAVCSTPVPELPSVFQEDALESQPSPKEVMSDSVSAVINGRVE